MDEMLEFFFLGLHIAPTHFLAMSQVFEPCKNNEDSTRVNEDRGATTW